MRLLGTTLMQRCSDFVLNVGNWRCVNVVQRWKLASDFVSFSTSDQCYFNVDIQRWNNVDIQRWNNVDPTLKLLAGVCWTKSLFHISYLFIFIGTFYSSYSTKKYSTSPFFPITKANLWTILIQKLLITGKGIYLGMHIHLCFSGIYTYNYNEVTIFIPPNTFWVTSLVT